MQGATLKFQVGSLDIIWMEIGEKTQKKREKSRGEAAVYSQGILVKAHTLETEANVERHSTEARVRRRAGGQTGVHQPPVGYRVRKRYALVPRASGFEKQRDTHSPRCGTGLKSDIQILVFIIIIQKMET